MQAITYVPGLGGGSTLRAQQRWATALNIFRPRRAKIHVFDPLWETPEPYKEKFERLREFHKQAGSPTTVWGISAGASMAVRLCSEYEDSFLHAVCGKILHPETIGLEYQRRAPAFVLSATYSHRLATQALGIRTRSYVPRNDADGVIASRDMLIPVAEQIDLPSLKHAQAIVYALVRYLPIT